MEPTLWQMVLTPLVVFPIVLLFRFTGCPSFGASDAPVEPTPPSGKTPPDHPTTPEEPTPIPTPPVTTNPPNYRKYILGEQPNPGTVKNAMVAVDPLAVIGYWRLVDAANPDDTTAKDEKATRNGIYVIGTSLNNVNPTAALGGSEAAPGTILNSQPGLIASDPTSLCRNYNGGYVQIPFSPNLHTDEFTIEAWVNLAALKPNYEHVLFDTGGRYAVPPAGVLDRGYRILADRAGNWQVRMASTQVVVFKTPPAVPVGGRTYFALVLKNHDAAGVQKDLTIYIDGKETMTQTIPTYALPENAPLFIAAENTTALPTQANAMRAPFLGLIQEVVLHKSPLSREEIENHVDINR